MRIYWGYYFYRICCDPYLLILLSKPVILPLIWKLFSDKPEFVTNLLLWFKKIFIKCNLFTRLKNVVL